MRIKTSIALFVALLGAGGQTVIAQTAPGVITACVSTKTGVMRLATAPSVGTAVGSETCKVGEVQVQWNVQGPAGATGAQGLPGATGMSGRPGPTGPMGMAGATGMSGR